jgi:hypothetical protein
MLNRVGCAGQHRIEMTASLLSSTSLQMAGVGVDDSHENIDRINIDKQLPFQSASFF